jgi:hypothetical protein
VSRLGSSVVTGPCDPRLAAGRSLASERLGDEFVFVQKAAEPVAAADVNLVGWGVDWDWLRYRRLLIERTMRSVRVVVGDVLV